MLTSYKLNLWIERNLGRNIFEREVEEMTGGWKELFCEELHNLFTSPTVATVIKSESIRSVGHILMHG
jgi:hypothetical protein